MWLSQRQMGVAKLLKDGYFSVGDGRIGQVEYGWICLSWIWISAKKNRWNGEAELLRDRYN